MRVPTCRLTVAALSDVTFTITSRVMGPRLRITASTAAAAVSAIPSLGATTSGAAGAVMTVVVESMGNPQESGAVAEAAPTQGIPKRPVGSVAARCATTTLAAEGGQR